MSVSQVSWGVLDQPDSPGANRRDGHGERWLFRERTLRPISYRVGAVSSTRRERYSLLRRSVNLDGESVAYPAHEWTWGRCQ